MNGSSIPVTKALFDESNWQELISLSKEKTCIAYNGIFTAQAHEATSRGDEQAHAVFLLLGSITSLLLRLENPEQPFVPLAALETGHTAILENFSDEDITIFKALVPDTQDTEMRARLADVVLCFVKKDLTMARYAVEAYLASASILENPEDWVPGAQHIERALQISAGYGKNGPFFPKVTQYIEGLLEKYDGKDPMWLSYRLMKLLLDHNYGSPEKYIALSEKIAKKAEQAGQWRKARDLWEIKAQWHGKDKNQEAAQQAMLLAAQTYVREADDAVNKTPPQFMIASRRIEEAIEAFRRIGNQPKEIEEQLKIQLMQYQEKASEAMKEVSFTVDASEVDNSARSAVKGQTIQEAIHILAIFYRATPYSVLHERVKRGVENSAFLNMIDVNQVNINGRRVGTRPALNLNDTSDEANQEFIRVEMHGEAALSRKITGGVVVLPAVDQINLEHKVSANDFLDIVHNNPFIPSDREAIYIKGLYAGMGKDFLISSHLLIPQLEHSIRHVLTQHGVITTTYDAEGVQNEMALGALLSKPEMNNIFGADIKFDLQGLLTESTGDNLRNRLSHGLIPHEEFYTNPSFVYLWWLTLHLCYAGKLLSVTST